MPEHPVLQGLLLVGTGLAIASLSVWTTYTAGCGPKWDLLVLLLGCSETDADEAAGESRNDQTL